MGCVLISGFASVYFERVLKKDHGGKAPTATAIDGIWVRNLQLYVSTVPATLIYALVSDREQILSQGFFYGYTPMVWVVVALQALGGQINAMIVNYTDNIVKMFAGGYVILAALLMEILLFQFRPTLMFGGGLVMVNVASVM